MKEQSNRNNNLGSLDDIRQNLEEKISISGSQAYCLDGRVFKYRTPINIHLSIGAYIQLKTKEGISYLGQIETRAVTLEEGPEYSIDIKYNANSLLRPSPTSELRDRIRIRVIQGTGRLLGKILKNKKIALPERKDTFVDAELSQADEKVVSSYLAWKDSKYETLDIGKELYSSDSVRMTLMPDGFAKHTLLCGQSGSGKSFSLGVLVEQILYNTNLRFIILDMNSDFVQLNRLRTYKEINATRSKKISQSEYANINMKYDSLQPLVQILSPTKYETQRTGVLRLSFSELDIFEQARVLRLNPITDSEEFHKLTEITRLMEVVQVIFRSFLSVPSHRSWMSTAPTP